MMNIVVGIDPAGLYQEALHLLSRLSFADSHLLLAHASEPIQIPAYAGALLAPMAELETARQEKSRRTLEEALEAAVSQRAATSATECPLQGPAAREIMELAETEHADLVAVGSRRQGLLGSVFMGSVGRALAIGAKESFLIARSGMAGRGDVRAIFATDHSAYADQCLDELLRLDPQGITDLQIVFAADGDTDSLRQAAGLEDRLDLSPDELMEKVKERGATLVDRCIESGRLAEYELVEDYPIDALRKKMYEAKADLLILGAQGHGFLERLLIGSLALHAAVAEPFSVMVIRLREAKS